MEDAAAGVDAAPDMSVSPIPSFERVNSNISLGDLENIICKVEDPMDMPLGDMVPLRAEGHNLRASRGTRYTSEVFADEVEAPKKRKRVLACPLCKM
jgi:hypothetical protein